jgi:hypothetical protein
MNNISKLIVVGSSLCLLAACSSSLSTIDEPKKIQEVYAEKLATVKIGMLLSEFRTCFPEAYVGGQSQMVTAYELKNTQKFILQSDKDARPVDSALGLYHPPPRTLTQVLWFYFYDDRLVQWGRPNDWPRQPDKILEIRTK